MLFIVNVFDQPDVNSIFLSKALFNRDPKARQPNPPRYLKIDSNKLIEKVFVRPRESDCLKRCVEDAATKYKLDAPVARSEMDSKPLF